MVLLEVSMDILETPLGFPGKFPGFAQEVPGDFSGFLRGFFRVFLGTSGIPQTSPPKIPATAPKYTPPPGGVWVGGTLPTPRGRGASTLKHSSGPGAGVCDALSRARAPCAPFSQIISFLDKFHIHFNQNSVEKFRISHRVKRIWQPSTGPPQTDNPQTWMAA